MDIEDILIENMMNDLKEIITGEIYNKSIEKKKIYFYFNYYSNDNHPYHSSRISLKSRHHHHHHHNHNRIGNNQSSSYKDHRFDRQTNNHDIYSTLLIDQPSLSDGLPPPADSYYSSSQSTRDRGLSSHYIDSERNRYSQTSSSNYR